MDCLAHDFSNLVQLVVVLTKWVRPSTHGSNAFFYTYCFFICQKQQYFSLAFKKNTFKKNFQPIGKHAGQFESRLDNLEAGSKFRQIRRLDNWEAGWTVEKLAGQREAG